MTIQYKNQGFNLSTTNLTTVLNIAVTAVAIVKSISVANTSSGAVDATLKLRTTQDKNIKLFFEA